MSSGADVLKRNHVTVRGRGSRTIVFGNGFALDHSSWRHLLPAFEREYRVVTFDYVGTGESDRSAYSPARYSSLQGYALDLLEVLDAISCSECVFVGASISGMFGLLAALIQPARFSRLIMVGASARYIDEPPDYHCGFNEQDIEGLLDLMEQNFVGWAVNIANTSIKDPTLAVELERGICALHPRIARVFVELAFRCDLRALLPHCQKPVLVVQCEHDDIVSNRAAEYLAAHLPQAEYRTLAVSGHCPQLSNPRELTALILDYLHERQPHEPRVSE